MNIVLDASATVPVLLEEQLGKETANLIASANSVIAPELFIPELGNVLWKYTNFAGLDREKAYELLFLGMNTVDFFYEQSALIPHALTVALDNGISVYDSVYLSLCIQEDHKIVEP